MSVDRLPLESPNDGDHYLGEAFDVTGLAVYDGVVSMASYTHVALSGISTSVDKALDGRLWWGMVGWLKLYTARALSAFWANNVIVGKSTSTMRYTR